MDTNLGESKLIRVFEPLVEVAHGPEFSGKGTKAAKLRLTDVVSTAEATTFPNSQSIQLTSITSTERDALTPVDGTVIYNSTTDRFEFYQAATWVYYTANTV